MKRHSRQRSSSVYDTDEEAKEKPKLRVLHPVNEKIKITTDYHAYRLEDQLPKVQ